MTFMDRMGKLEMMMDPVLAANMKTALCLEAGKQDDKAAKRAYERERLRQNRNLRGQMAFMDRMGQDITSKQLFSQMAAVKQNPGARRRLDMAIELDKPKKSTNEPVIAKYDHKILYHGQDRKNEWAPLEYY